MKLPCGIRGCCGGTNRRKGGAKKGRLCAQLPVWWDEDDNGWCYYHDPRDPRKFGERCDAPRKEPSR